MPPLTSTNATPVWLLRQEEDLVGKVEKPGHSADNLSEKDKNGNLMVCVGQINFYQQEDQGAQLKSGLLRLFVSERHKSFAIKDGTCFKVTWTLGAAPLNVVSLLRGKKAKLCQSFIVEEESLRQESYFLYDRHPRLQEAKLVSAFAANGITYSALRSQDSCYQHLIDAAQDWMLLWRIPYHDADLLLMIKDIDWQQAAVEKSFLVRFWA